MTRTVTRPARGSLLVRLYALGVVQLFVVGCAVAVIGFLVARPPPHGHTDRLAMEAAAARITPALHDAHALSLELTLLRKHYGLEITVYDPQRNVLASTAEPPLAIDAGRHRHGFLHFPFLGPPPRPPAMMMPIHTPSGEGTLMARKVHPEVSYTAPILTFLCGVLIVGLGAWVMARFIVRPLEQLSQAARALGSGDLSARSGLSRADEIGQLSRTFDEMAERMRALVLAEKELMANVSHELKTPLARIRVALDLASEGDAAAARTALAEIAVDLEELESLVADILTATRMELAGGEPAQQGFRLHRELTAPRQIVAEAVKRFLARHPGRPLELAGDQDLPAVNVDAALFRRVLDNLLDNAHKYSADDDRPVSLRVTRAGGEVIFEVEDSGIGIAAEDLPRVFAPFFRAERSRSRTAGGTGLGLTLVERIVQAHGGKVEIESQLGVGTKVRVRLEVAC